MSVAALIEECRSVGLKIRRHGDRLDLNAAAPPPVDLLERLRAAKPELLETLPDDGPTETCPKCGGRNFWRESMTTDQWRCRCCVPPYPGLWTDGVFLPPPRKNPK